MYKMSKIYHCLRQQVNFLETSQQEFDIDTKLDLSPYILQVI